MTYTCQFSGLLGCGKEVCMELVVTLRVKVGDGGEKQVLETREFSLVALS